MIPLPCFLLCRDKKYRAPTKVSARLGCRLSLLAEAVGFEPTSP